MDKVISATLKVLLVLASLWIIYFLRNVLGYFIFAFFIASALRPGVDFLEKKKVPRIASTVLMFLLFLGFVVFAVTLVLPPFVNEIQNFITTSPEISQSFIVSAEKVGKTLNINIIETIKNFFSIILQRLASSLSGAIGAFSGLFSGFYNLMFVAIISFYLTVVKKSAERFSYFVSSSNKKTEEKILKAWKRAEKIAGRWLSGYLILGTIVAFAVYVGLSMVGVRYTLVLAVVAGIFEIIPFFGPFLAGAIGTLFAVFQGGFPLAIWTIIVFLAVQGLENFLIVPFVMKNRVDLHPVLVIVILFIAGKIFGLLGIILSIPLTAIIIALVKENYSDYFIERKVKPLFFKHF